MKHPQINHTNLALEKMREISCMLNFTIRFQLNTFQLISINILPTPSNLLGDILGWVEAVPPIQEILGVRLTTLHCKFFPNLILLNILKVLSIRNLLGPSKHFRDGGWMSYLGASGGYAPPLKRSCISHFSIRELQ